MRHTALLAAILIFLLSAAPALASEANIPYQSYTYDYRENVVLTPAPYVPAGSVSGASLGISPFSKASDLATDAQGRIYVADTGNNRVVVIGADMKSADEIITEFYYNGERGAFGSPSGLAVSERGQLYIADSGNRRVVVLEPDHRTCARIIRDPVNEALPAGFVFTPLRVAVDYADRVYVIAQNMFQGIMVFEGEGEFTGFFGTINVQITLWQRFWRAIATRAERANTRLFVPTEFTGLDVDPSGFVYASNMDPQGAKAVRRLNPKGEDVALQGISNNTGGDIIINSTNGPYGGPSRIVDVVYQGKGIYSLLDSQRGRIFTYDREGNLLYIFGGLGSQAGAFRTPAAIERAGDGILVLDYVRNEIIIFHPTEYGRLINEAVGLRFDGDEVLAVEKWRQVLKINANLELANTGIGKAYLAAGDNLQAMRYLKLGMNRTYYSIAFKRYRNEILKQNLGWMLTAGLVLIAGAYLIPKLTKRGGRKRIEYTGTGLMGDD